MLKKTSFLSVLYIIAWCISPPLEGGMIYRVLTIIALFVVYVSSLNTALAEQRKRLTRSVLLSVYFVVVAILCGENYNVRIGVIVFLLTSSVFEIWLGESKTTSKQIMYILLWTVILYDIWNTTTIRVVLELPGIMRQLVSTEKALEASQTVSVSYVGGYGYMFSVIMMLPVGINMLLNKNIKIKFYFRAFLLYFVVSSMFLAYISQYLLALIIAIFAAVLTLTRRQNFSTFRIRNYLPLLLFLLLVLLLLEPILDFLIQVVDLPTINNKLVDMRTVLVTGGDIDDSDFSERYIRYTRDLKIIFTSPLWGAFQFGAIGKHSTFLDMLAQYGVFIGGLAISQIMRPCMVWVRKNVTIASVTLMVLLFVGLFDTMTLQIAVPLCIVLPAYCKLLWGNY